MTIDSIAPFEGNGSDNASLDAAPTDSPVNALWIAPAEELASDPVAQPDLDLSPVAATLVEQPELGTLTPAPSRRWFRRGVARERTPRVASRRRRLAGFAVAFVVGTAAVALLACATVYGLSNTYHDRVLPSVRVGTVDLSGLTRAQAMDRLRSDYATLGKGLVTITTPTGTSTITYEQAKRGPDVEVMADAAMSAGHSGNPFADAASVLHSAVFGQDLPVVVQIDPTAVAQRIHDLDIVTSVAPQDAQATSTNGNFGVTPSKTGSGMDEMSTASKVIDQLTQPGAAADIKVAGTFVTLAPHVGDKDAQAAIDRAEKMAVNVNITWVTPPAAAPATWKPQSWMISASQIRSWIVFGIGPDGTYAPAVDAIKEEAYLSEVTAKGSVAPVEPGVIWDASGKPSDLTPGKDGSAVDVAGTTSAVSAHLDALLSGSGAAPTVEVVTAPVHPQITSIDNIANMVVVGSWTTTFYPDVSNGFGKNIRQPAVNLNGQVINPGQQFSFLGAVGPIDPAHGFTLGGVILGGKSNHTGAMGGGICSASTTMFNAAATAGLQIDERHAHAYYIYRYPIGRDATVYSNGVTTYDLRWTNDTPYPIVIRAWSTPGSKSTITVQLWSWPLNRTVTWTGGGKANIVDPVENPPEYVTTLAPGVTNRTEYGTAGFRTGVARVVTDASGAVIHSDSWGSAYEVVNGQLQIGGSPPAPPAPTPPPVDPVPTPAPTPPPSAPPATQAPVVTPAP